MKTRFWLIVFGWLLAAPAGAQFLGPPQNITVVDSGTACVTAPAACATFDASTAISVAFDISGTWTGTLTFEATANGSVWRTLWVTNAATGAQQGTTTAGGTFTAANGGFTAVRVRATLTVTGLAVVSGTRGYGISARTPASNLSGVVLAVNGGTGQSGYAVGDLLTANTTTTLSKVADVAAGSVLASGGVGVVPAWSANPTLTGLTLGAVNVTTAATGVAAGYKVARGATAFDGANPTTVATGLTSVVSCTATLRLAAAITTGTAFVTHDAPSGANVDFYAWILAGTASIGTETFDWICLGT